MASPKPKVSLKLLIDEKNKNVLFAEAGKDFVDFLFYLMALPVGTVIDLIKEKGMVGCLTNLYESIENLSDTYLLPTKSKDSLLKPKSSVPPSEFPLMLTGSDSKGPKFYCAPVMINQSGFGSSYRQSCICVSDVLGTSCACGAGAGMLNTEARFVAGNAAGCTESSGSGVGFVKGVVTYMVMNDLSVQPMSSISCIALLNKFNVSEVGCLREKVVDFGMEEALKLLEASFRTKTVLTDVFLNNV